MSKPPTPLQAVPASLRELVRQIDDADELDVAPDLERDATALIEAAWNGSMCESIVRRKIPLADAVQRSTAELDAAAFAYITTVPARIRAMVGNAFDDAHFMRDNLKAFCALKSLKFENLGTAHYEHIQAALTENEGVWRGGSHKDDVYVIQQFCVRIVQLTESLRQRTGRRIANDVAMITASDATGDAGRPFEEPRRLQLVYNSAAGRIMDRRNWPQRVAGPFDWALLFGHLADDDDEEDGPWLTPRMAARIHCAAIEDAERMMEAWKDDRSSPRLPKLARPFFKKSKEWRDSFQECYLRIAMRLQKGLPPRPNCTGEELAFHIIMQRVEGDELGTDFDESFDALPRFANDENYSGVKDIAVDDEDVLMLYENGDNGYSDSDSDEPSVDNSVLGPGSLASFLLGSGGDLMRVAHIHPTEWFHAFRSENFKDHLPDAAA